MTLRAAAPAAAPHAVVMKENRLQAPLLLYGAAAPGMCCEERPRGTSDAPRAVSSLLDDIFALFLIEKTPSIKKRKRQRLSETEKIKADYAAVEGVHAVSNLLAAATKPMACSADPIVQWIAECITYSAEKLKSCASALNLVCLNTMAKVRKFGSPEVGKEGVTLPRKGAASGLWDRIRDKQVCTIC